MAANLIAVQKVLDALEGMDRKQPVCCSTATAYTAAQSRWAG